MGTITPTFVLTARASYNRFIEKGYGKANEGFDLSKWGLPSSLLSQLPGKSYFGRFNFYSGISGTTGVYNSLGRGQSNNFTNTYQLSFSATKIWGRHSVKMGRRHAPGELPAAEHRRRAAVPRLCRLHRKELEPGRLHQRRTPTPPSCSAFPEGYSYYALFPWWRNNYYAFYVQDDWKVSRRLTLNLGLRNDINTPAREKWNRMNGPFDPTAKSQLASQFSAATLAMYPQLANLNGSFSFAGVGGVGSTPGPDQQEQLAAALRHGLRDYAAAGDAWWRGPDLFQPQ